MAVPAGRCVTLASADAAAADLGFPVALKAVSTDLPHKTEAGAVILGLADREAVETAAQAMVARLAAARPAHRIERLLVEAMAPRPVAELIVGIDRDPHFGPVLAIGAGGVFAELLGDVATLLLPAYADDVRTALLGLKVAALLAGFRGGPPGDIDAAVAAIVAIGEAALATPELLELDVNPLFVLPRSQGVIAVDALLVMAEDRSGTGENFR
ncbi:MAG: acetate--CoA ligase family protein [Proteobacteria bacterium]|nr:acetate--CoA ligase family protein [Pseudomonadota bacterium]MDA1072142.1 acetate--CoA ligase family protein [Pseudomonadota bacterium]